MLNLVIISGSAREGRRSHAMALALLDKISKIKDVNSELLDIKEYNFPLLNYTFRNHPDPSATMRDFHNKLEKADGMLVVSPEYNNSFSGALKNTMDYFYPEYAKKAAGIVTVSAGKMGGINAAKHLQHYILTLKAIPLPQILTTPNVDDHFEGNELKDEDFSQRMDKFLDDFILFTKAINTYRAQ